MNWKFRLGLLISIASIVGCTVDVPNASTPSLEGDSASTSTSATENVSSLQGTVKIDGSSTVFPISESAASSFHEKYPSVDVTVGKKGTGGGLSEFIKGEIDIADASRPMKTNELEEAKKNSIKFMELPIAYDGITICVHKDNDFISEVTVDQLRIIYSAEPGIKSWKELDPGFPDQPFKIFMPGTDSGTYDFFKEVVVGKDGHVRADVTPSEEDLVLVNGIASEKFGIGFFGASYYFENRDRVKALKVVDPKTNEAVEATVENIENAKYSPLGRPLFIYVNIQSVKRPEVRRFVEFYLDEAVNICEAAGCVPLTKDLYKTVRQRFDDRLDGSYFYDSEGKSRAGTLAEVYVESNRIPFE